MKIFIAGPRLINELDTKVTDRLDNIFKKNYTVIVGDANGVDNSVQRYFYDKNYKQVFVFASNGKARNNIGNWEIINVAVDDNVKGFDFYSAKDLEMAKEADYGFMIWNGESKGTFNNILNLLNLGKELIIYYTPSKKFYTIKKTDDFDNFLEQEVKLNPALSNLVLKKIGENRQASMF